MSQYRWFVVYKSGQKFRETLEQRNIQYFIPTTHKEMLSKDGKEMVGVETPLISNIVFVRTDQDIRNIVEGVDGLRAPFKDYATGLPAVVADEEMERFMTFVKACRDNVQILRDPYSKFAPMQKVCVREGEFKGAVGHVVRILRDRKLVVSLGTMAVAVSGIHHSLLEPID